MNINDIIDFCEKPKSLSQISVKFKDFNKKDLKKTVNKLINEQEIIICPPKKDDKSQKPEKKFANRTWHGLVSGKIQTTSKGYSFVTPTVALASGRDIFIPEKLSSNAWNNDEVLVKLRRSRYRRDKRGERQEGEVIRVLERKTEIVSGSLVKMRDFVYLQSKNKSLPPILVKNCDNFDELQNKLIGVKISFYGNKNSHPEGKIVSIFGEIDTKQASINMILENENIKEEFPPMVLVQTKGVSQEITPENFSDRLDLTEKMIFTIDGDYSKDFDDAVSLEKNEQGHYVLGVHIADVSYYVTEGSPLDNEAFARGTSVYFANKVIPMLPFELSNGICSLNPHENRFAFSVFMEFNSNFDVMNSTFHKSVICSKHRLTYNNVNKVLDNDSEMCEKYAEIKDLLVDMNNIALKLEQKRLDKGYIELEIPESYILTDENDVAIDVKLRTRGQSEKLIEQFMVLTNENVAKFMEKENIPSVYRVHEPPNADKLKTFASIARNFGFKISDDETSDKTALNRVLTQSLETPYANALSIMILRSLSRAKYQDENIGHDGLALENYLHFTSPIRRYPDLVVHRMLDKKLRNEKFILADRDFVTDASIQSTDRENHADIASRDIEKLYKAEFLSQFIGEEFDVTVSGVQNFGIFVALDNSVEGLIRKESFADDEYIYNEDEIKYIGTRTKKVYTIGTKFRARLISASCVNGQIDFEFVK